MEKKIKIVCTIGPATWDPEVIRKMIDAGMNCARVNGAFADPEELDKVKNLIKSVSSKVALMVDVKGPDVRMNEFSEPKIIKPSDVFEIGNDESSAIYPANYKDLYKILSVGQRILIGDGDVELVVKQIDGDKMICEVVYGEVLKPGKALNLPGARIGTEVLTEKDKINLTHAMQTGWDMVSASFIQSASAARQIRDFIGDNPMKLIAKIEDQEGINNINEILDNVDGIMVARGGLGVELGLEKVPLAQKKLVKAANDAGKLVITATQMLESMISNPRPTRAEVNDVAVAILCGSDAVMLSGESSVGKYPVEAVNFLSKVSMEIQPEIKSEIFAANAKNVEEEVDAIAKSAAELCIDMNNAIQKVITVDFNGDLARLVARNKIAQPIYSFVKGEFELRNIMMYKGVVNAFTFKSEFSDRDDSLKFILEQSLKEGIIKTGEKVLVLSIRNDNPEFLSPNLFEIINV